MRTIAKDTRESIRNRYFDAFESRSMEYPTAREILDRHDGTDEFTVHQRPATLVTADRQGDETVLYQNNSINPSKRYMCI